MRSPIRPLSRLLFSGTVICVLLLCLAVWDFDRRTRSTVSNGQFPPDAVVFTGQFDRIRHGLRLLKEGHVERLFVSGANSGAGIAPERFATQFELEGSLLEALRDGRLILATRAETTLQNAAETACWWGSRQGASLVLITTTIHMPRASLALESMIGTTEVLRDAVPEKERASPLRRISEFVGYLATRVVAATPTLFKNTFGPYADDCP